MNNEEAKDLLDNLIGMVEDNQNNDYDEALKLAIRSLKSWEEVLNELLEQLEDSIPNPTRFLALLDAIAIINKYLAEIK